MTDDGVAILGSYADRFPAEALAAFLTAANVPCTVGDPQPGVPEAYTVYVPHRLLGEIRKLLDWTSVAEYRDVVSAMVVSGRLASEKIPSTVAGSGSRMPGPFNVYVPKRLKTDAQRVLAEAPISDSELTELALSQPAEDSDAK